MKAEPAKVLDVGAPSANVDVMPAAMQLKQKRGRRVDVPRSRCGVRK